jgi:hypothetical protein
MGIGFRMGEEKDEEKGRDGMVIEYCEDGARD